MNCAPSKDSDQPGHSPSLIRIFAVRMKKPYVLNYPLSAKVILLILSCCGSNANAQPADMSLVMRQPVYAICEQQRRRSACAPAQSDLRLCCSLPRYCNTSSFYIRNFKTLPSSCGCAGRFESTLVENPEDRYSRDDAHRIFL